MQAVPASFTPAFSHCGPLTVAMMALALLTAGCGTAESEPRIVSAGGSTTPQTPRGSSAEKNPTAAEQDLSAENEETAAALAELCQALFPDRQPRALAMIFVLPDCPIANSYAAEFNRLHAEFSSRGIPLVLVYADPDLTTAAMQQHVQDFLVNCPALLDPHQDWVRRAGATTTPEAAVFSLNGSLLYRGRIDDRYAAVGKRRQVATTHDLREALSAIAAGEIVPQARTAAVGCHIPLLSDEP